MYVHPKFIAPSAIYHRPQNVEVNPFQRIFVIIAHMQVQYQVEAPGVCVAPPCLVLFGEAFLQNVHLHKAL